ncbi:MAG: hypothetical protein ACK4HE_03100 [Chitinophagaceae bacterium]
MRKYVFLYIFLLLLHCIAKAQVIQEETYYDRIDTMAAVEEIESDNAQVIKNNWGRHNDSNFYFSIVDTFLSKQGYWPYYSIAANSNWDTSILAWKQEDAFWYNNAVDSFRLYLLRLDSLSKIDSAIGANKQVLKKEQEQRFRTGNIQSIISDVLWWVIVMAFVAAIIYFLIQQKVGLFGGKNFKQVTPIVDKDALDTSLSNYDFKQRLQKAVSEQNYRLAIRIHFLFTLKLLSEQHYIQYAVDATNFQYQLQLRNTNYYTLFAKVVMHYEYVWYGKQIITLQQYEQAAQDFLTLQQNLV